MQRATLTRDFYVLENRNCACQGVLNCALDLRAESLRYPQKTIRIKERRCKATVTMTLAVTIII